MALARKHTPAAPLNRGEMFGFEYFRPARVNGSGLLQAAFPRRGFNDVRLFTQPILIMTTLPQDFAMALKAAGLAGFFSDCTSAHQNEYLKWIGEAKRPATRQARITKAMQMISDKCAEEQTRKRK